MKRWNFSSFSIIKLLFYNLIIVLWIIVLGSCSSATDVPIKSLRISVLPDRSAEEIKKSFSPLISYIEKELQLKIEFVEAKDYQDLLDKFRHQELDLVRFGGYTFINAKINANAIPLVMRDVDIHFHSYFLVKAGDNATSIADYKGKRFGFGSKLSNSGHLMPRYFLSLENITPENYFSEVLYSGAHDKTAEWVKNGIIDIGVSNTIVVDRLYQQGLITTNQVRILSRTPAYSNYVWAIQPNLPESLVNRMREAFLKLSIDNPDDKEILDAVGAKMYIPAKQEDFQSLEFIANELNMLDQ